MKTLPASLIALAMLSAVLVTCSRPEPRTAPPAAPEASSAAAKPSRTIDHAAILAPLMDPAKLDTLKGDRAANPRLRKACHWLAVARSEGVDPAGVIDRAQDATGYAGTPRAKADRAALLRNLEILDRLGCLGPDNMANLRRGKAPTITRGPYADSLAEVDHIIPRALAPELDEKLFNLEFMPAAMNRRKSATIGPRQRAMAKEWKAAGLLSQTLAE